MRVLLVSVKSEKSKGGIAVWTEQYLQKCNEFDVNCDLVNIEMIGKRAISTTSKRIFRDELVRTFGIFRQLKQKLRLECIDVAHINTSVGSLGIIRDYHIARRIEKKKIPIALHFHCDVVNAVTNPFVFHYLKKILKLSKINFVLCENSKQYLKKVFGAESVEIANFVDEAMIATTKSISDEIRSVLFIGRVSESKGAREIYELARRFPQICFQVIGEVSEQVAGWDRPENVELLGTKAHGDVIKKLDDADVFFFPSHTEGFSVSLVEAMSRGVPIVATDVGANMEMVEQRGGVIVGVGDVDAMEDAFNKICDKATRKGMSAWNLNKVKACYAADKIMLDLKRYYLSICDSTN